MPPDGYTSITVPEYLLDRLDRHRHGGGYAEAIEGLIDRVEGDGDTEPTDEPLTPAEFESRMRDIADDIASTTSKRTADELENRLR